MLKRILLLAAAVFVLSGATLFFGNYYLWPLGSEWFIIGAIVLVAVIFEGSHYRPKIDRNAAGWEPTGERFVDPTSGKLVEVRYNPTSGERDYIEVR
ncbi:MAG: hypothetical protein ACP5O6_06835 [Candidatus Baltobacteraceae bacterium]